MSNLSMRSLPDMIAGLRALGSHIKRMDSGSGDAALIHDAVNYIEGATDSLREHMAELLKAREQTAMVRKQAEETDRLSHDLGFMRGRDRAVAILMRKAHASEDDDLTPIEEAIREQLIYAAREIRELKP